MTITRTMAALTVLWKDRKNIWQRMIEAAARVQPIVLLFLLVALAGVIGARVKLNHDTRIEAEQEMRLSEERQEALRAAALNAEQRLAQEAAAQSRSDREAVAKVLYGTALHHSEDAQKAVVWCILNRVDSSLYPNSIQEVCSQPSQWMGYADDNPVISSLYEIADEVISGWESGGYRAVSPDYLFLSWTQDEIVLRTTFNETSRTHYWRCG